VIRCHYVTRYARFLCNFSSFINTNFRLGYQVQQDIKSLQSLLALQVCIKFRARLKISNSFDTGYNEKGLGLHRSLQFAVGRKKGCNTFKNLEKLPARPVFTACTTAEGSNSTSLRLEKRGDIRQNRLMTPQQEQQQSKI
jgi:hypothetical protein